MNNDMTFHTYIKHTHTHSTHAISTSSRLHTIIVIKFACIYMCMRLHSRSPYEIFVPGPPSC